jgi:nucleoid-associated protein
MKLYITGPSPFARKCRIVAREKGLADRIEEIAVDPYANAPELLASNPLVQVPTLIAGAHLEVFDREQVVDPQQFAAVMADRQLTFAARLNVTQWQGGDAQTQYVSFIKERGGNKLADALATCLGVVEGADAPADTRTLLKAFSDYVEKEDLDDEASREKTDALVGYANEQLSRGEPMTLTELSGLVDEQQPKAFYDHIRNADYGLAPEIPPDKRTLNQFRRFTGRAGGVSVSFDSHLLGDSVEYDETADRLIIKQVPKQLKEQLQRRD